MLLVSLGFNVYAVTYNVWTTSWLSSPDSIQLSAQTAIKFQLDSLTDIVFYAETPWQTGDTHIDWTADGGELLFTTNWVHLWIWWHGNVSNVELDSTMLANFTYHTIETGSFHSILWNWQGAFVVPPASEYWVQFVGININDSSFAEGIPFSLTIDEGYNDTYYTEYYTTNAIFQCDSTHVYKCYFPETYALNDTYYLEFVNITRVTDYDTPYSYTTSMVFIVDRDTTWFVYYMLVPTPAEFLLPISFVLGMVGLASLFIGPMYGIHKIRHKEYRNGFIYATIIFSIGFALFISWLWH